MNESFVNLETARQLRAIGFDEPCSCYYSVLDGYVKSIGDSFIPGYRNSLLVGIENYAKPTIQMAIAWLEQKHHIYVMVAPYKPGLWKTIMVYTNNPDPRDGKLNVCELDGIHKSHDEAANYGLMYGLDLVKKIQEKLKEKGGGK